MNIDGLIVHPPPQPSPSERVKIWRERVAMARHDASETLKNPNTKELSKWFEGIADATDRCADELEHHVLKQIDCVRLQCLERIAETADELEGWMGENVGDSDEWPIRITGDQDGTSKLCALINDLRGALESLTDEG